MFLEVFFHFFCCRLSDDTNAVVVDFNFLTALAVLVFGCGYHDFLNKFVYQFGREGFQTGNLFCLDLSYRHSNDPAFAFDFLYVNSRQQFLLCKSSGKLFKEFPV